MFHQNRKADEILEDIRSSGTIGVPEDIFRQLLPPPEWWKIVSSAAKLNSDRSFFRAGKEISLARDQGIDMPAWPSAMYHQENTLPALTQDEALGILERFSIAEAGRVKPGLLLHALQWDCLAAIYRPLRERYTILESLARLGLLERSVNGRAEKGVYWPLALNKKTVAAIRKAHRRAQLPTFARVEEWLMGVKEAFGLSLTILISLIAGGFLSELLGWLFSLLPAP